MERYQRELRDIARERGVTQILHFTRVENAHSILENGFAGRTWLDDAGIKYLPTDDWRGDDHPEAFSTSIHGLYWEMLEAKRRLMGGEWVAFGLDASILWTHHCRFCWQNASSKEIRKKGALAGPWSFERMFQDRDVSYSDKRSFRETYQRDLREPTEESAEVQVREPVDRELIVAVAVESEWRKTKLEATMPELHFIRPVEVWKEGLLP